MYRDREQLRHWLIALRQVGARAALWVVAACSAPSQDPGACDFVPKQSAPGEVAAVAAQFVSDASWRRQCLERSLVNPQSGYAKSRLTNYRPEAWGKLPPAAFRTRPVKPSDLGRPRPTPDASWTSMATPWAVESETALRQRGAQMFARFPAQIEHSMMAALRDEASPARYGLWRTEDSIGGLQWVALPGGVYPALSCATCHATVGRDGTLRLGVPNHRLDIGKAKDEYAGTATLFSTWGPGRVDVAADGVDNATVIADLRAVRFQRQLHRTANVKNSLVMLALRVETGLIRAHRSAVRPDTRDSFALAYYLWTLGEQLDGDAASRHPARRVFQRHCAACHQGLAHAGEPVLPEVIDSPLAGLPSPERGTGHLRIPSLLGVSSRERLLYTGSAEGVRGLLALGRGEGGHYVGRGLTEQERESIQRYLESL